MHHGSRLWVVVLIRPCRGAVRSSFCLAWGLTIHPFNGASEALILVDAAEIETYQSERRYSLSQTVRKKSQRLNFTRFGDGELELMLISDLNLKPQVGSRKMCNELKQVIRPSSRCQNLVIGILKGMCIS